MRLVVLWLATRLILWGMGSWAATHLSHLPGEMPPAHGPWLDAWNRGDTWLYLDIAQHGYRPGFNGNYGWFPGYPLWLRWFNFGLPLLAAGLLWSNLALLGALLVWERLQPEKSWRSQVFLLTFPSAFFLFAPLPESLYLLFSLGAFWGARQGRWAVAGLLGACATATRPVGLLLFPAFLWEWRQKRGWGMLWLLLLPLTWLAFCLHLQEAVGDFWGYLHLQQRLEPYISAWPLLLKGRPLALRHQLGLLFALISLALLLLGWNSMRGSERIYVVLALLLPLPHTLWLAQPRLMLVLFPLFSESQRRFSPRLFWTLAGLCFVLQLIALAQFVRGHPDFLY